MRGFGHRRLFSEFDMFSVLENQRAAVQDEINAMEGNRLLNTSVGDLCNYCVEKYAIEVPVLDEDGIHADQREAQIDVSQEFGRDIRDRSRPYHITGTAIDAIVPFSGDAQMFKVRPSTFDSLP